MSLERTPYLIGDVFGRLAVISFGTDVTVNLMERSGFDLVILGRVFWAGCSSIVKLMLAQLVVMSGRRWKLMCYGKSRKWDGLG